MEVIPDFQDLLLLLSEHQIRYLIIGGLAFIYHAKPRYTKDIDIWLDAEAENVQQTNAALAEFGSPLQLDVNNPSEILQLGVAPNRIDLLRDVEGVSFAEAWARRIDTAYGTAPAHWIDIDSLILIKSKINEARHQDDVRVLKLVQERQQKKKQTK